MAGAASLVVLRNGEEPSSASWLGGPARRLEGGGIGRMRKQDGFRERKTRLVYLPDRGNSDFSLDPSGWDG